MKKLLILTMLVVASVSGFAQTAKIDVACSSHNFGKIVEKDGTVTHNFEFTNSGDAPLVITRVSTTCTCTKITYTKKPIKQGEKGVITVSYNPKNQNGMFAKKIEVFSNAINKKTLLTITGEVASATAK